MELQNYIDSNINDYINNKGYKGAKDNGKLRIEGKEYVVKDGDIILFNFVKNFGNISTPVPTSYKCRIAISNMFHI